MRTLHLTIKKEWFDKIASGEKTIEYREYKPYWISRLETFLTYGCEKIIFRNGYKKDSPTITASLLVIRRIENGMRTDLKIHGPVFGLWFEVLEVRR